MAIELTSVDITFNCFALWGYTQRARQLYVEANYLVEVFDSDITSCG